MAKWRLRLFWAGVLAVFTAWAVSSYLGSLQEKASLVLAAQEIPARTQITREMVRVVEINKADLESLAPDSFHSADQVVGRYARRSIPAGEILRDRRGDLTEPGMTPASGYAGEGALADFLPPGTRAVTVKVDQEAILGEHVRRGDRVDMVFTSKSDSTGGVYASLVVQQVTVLSIDRNEDDPDDILVTLLVTGQQAVQIALAKRTGDVDLVLNPPDPGDPLEVRAVSPLIFTRQADPAPAPAGDLAGSVPPNPKGNKGQ